MKLVLFSAIGILVETALQCMEIKKYYYCHYCCCDHGYYDQYGFYFHCIFNNYSLKSRCVVQKQGGEYFKSHQIIDISENNCISISGPHFCKCQGCCKSHS